MNITDSLKELYVAFGGNIDDIVTLSNITDVSNAIAVLLGGEGNATSISEAIQNIIPIMPNPKDKTMLVELIDRSITTAEFPEVTSIGANAFNSCTNLTTVNLPEVTSIGVNTFNSCTNLTTVNLPKATSIPNGLFSNLTNLTTVNLPEVTSIGVNTFNSCTNLTTVNLPKATSIGESVFVDCTKLTTINLPKVTSLGNYCFLRCSSLTTVDLFSMTSIGNNLFSDCSSLTALIIRTNAVTPITAFNTFNNTPIASGTGYIYVPDDLVDSYKAASGWSTYATQIKAISELPTE